METLRNARLVCHSDLPKGDLTNSFHVRLDAPDGTIYDFVIYDRTGLLAFYNSNQLDSWGPVYGKEKHEELMALAKAKIGQIVDVDHKKGVLAAIRDADPTYVPVMTTKPVKKPATFTMDIFKSMIERAK